MFNEVDIIKKLKNSTVVSDPFDHIIIDDFFDLEYAKYIESFFPEYESDVWHVYSNKIEQKKTCNSWNLFAPPLYKLFHFLNSDSFVNPLSALFDVKLCSDPGLHGGGLHIHSSGGNLNPHFDSSIHPKIGLQRKINIIIYLSSDAGLDISNEGALGLWSGDSSSPNELVKSVKPVFNRAVIFDTTQNSWHGMVTPLSQDADYCRKSLAAYYLKTPDDDAPKRTRAFFAPRDNQKSDDDVLDLIKLRASESGFEKAYIKK